MSRAPLSLLHFSTADRSGGSARSAYRIHSAMRARGHRSRMLVGWRDSDDADVDSVWRGRAARLADRAANSLSGHLGHQYRYLPSTRRTLAHPWLAQAQVIQLYNTHGGYLETGALPRLSSHAPLVWRLSDMWPATGHCAYSAGCERWRTGCGECPDLATYPGIGRDTTARLWQYKDELYRQCRITVVAPSSWTERIARDSPLLGRFPVRRIPNGIDLATFRPLERDAAREAFGIDAAAKVILFTAHGLDGNVRKGSEDAIEALRRLGPRGDVLLVLAGEGGASWAQRVPLRTLPLGFVRGEERLSQLYASADMLLAPSRSENLPNNVLEALACGVPAVAWDAGGMRDAVRHLDTGWLSAAGDVDGTVAGLRRLLDDEALRRRLGEAARRLAQSEFSQEREAASFESLYFEVAGR